MVVKLFRAIEKVFEEHFGIIHLQVAVRDHCLGVENLRDQPPVLAETISICHSSDGIPSNPVAVRQNEYTGVIFTHNSFHTTARGLSEKLEPFLSKRSLAASIEFNTMTGDPKNDV